MSEAIYQSAKALWPELVARAGLTGQHGPHTGAYDKGLVEEVREALFPGAEKPIEDLLAISDLSAEQLLRALFGAARPFALMKLDILNLLEAAGARGGGDSIRLRFAFDPENPLDLLLEQFRAQMELVEEAFGETDALGETPVPTRLGDLTLNQLSELPRAGGIDLMKDPIDHAPPSLRAWLEHYEMGFEQLPPNWRTGRVELDERLERVARLLEPHLAAVGQAWPDYPSLKSQPHRTPEAMIEASGLSWGAAQNLEIDRWSRAIVRMLVHAHARVSSSDEAAIAKMMDDLDRLLPTPATRAKALMRKLADVLDLPVWKHRHEVYAVWLGAQMHQALADRWNFRFHLVDGALKFPFGGAHLATLFNNRDDEVLFWWTELGTPHDDLPSGKRTEGIQPDYRLQRAPLGALAADVAVVEAKQHRGYSTKEFQDALTDYAHACPSAGVLLANYGPVAASALGVMISQYRPRCATFARMHPLNTEAVQAFRKTLARTVDRVLDGLEPDMDGRATPPAPSAKTLTTISLTWGAEPDDLDLYVRRVDEPGPEVSYHYPCAEGLGLREDITEGFGPEIVDIVAPRGRYEVTVRRHPDGEPIGAAAMVEVTFPGADAPVTLALPQGCAANHWRVGIVDVGARTVSQT